MMKTWSILLNHPHPVSCALPAQLAGVIRCRLSQLKPQNAHHEFEHLCRHLARAPVYSNVLPATRARGCPWTGGRDLKPIEHPRYRRIRANPRFSSVRQAIGKWRLLACLLEEAIGSEIRKDVRRILANGKFVEVVVFCEANIPVAQTPHIASVGAVRPRH
jgi:hypothetical protein